MPKVLVLDDHPLLARGLALYLQAAVPDLTLVEASSWAEVDDRLRDAGPPAVLIADIWLAEGNSLALLDRWQTRCPGVPWLAISGDDDPGIPQRVRAAGAQGFVQKQSPAAVFGRAVQALLNGGLWFETSASLLPRTAIDEGPKPHEWTVTPLELGLTARQGEILALVLRGQSNKRIALTLDIAEATVKEHMTSILQRLGVRTRLEALTQLRGRRLVTETTTPLRP